MKLPYLSYQKKRVKLSRLDRVLKKSLKHLHLHDWHEEIRSLRLAHYHYPWLNGFGLYIFEYDKIVLCEVHIGMHATHFSFQILMPFTHRERKFFYCKFSQHKFANFKQIVLIWLLSLTIVALWGIFTKAPLITLL